MASHDDPNNPRIEPRFSALFSRRRNPGENPQASADNPLRNKIITTCVAVGALAAFASIAWYATSQGQKDSSTVVPLIRANKDPIKTRPQRPGGLEIPNRDKKVFSRISPNADEPKVERLLPPPEKPLSKPARAAKSATANPPTGPLVPEAPSIRPRETTASAPKASSKATIKKAAKRAAKRLPRLKVSKGTYQVQLGAVRSKAKASKEVSRIKTAYGKVLGNIKVSAVRADLGKRGIYYRLRAGPLNDRTAATALCRKLAARKLSCMVVKP